MIDARMERMQCGTAVTATVILGTVGVEMGVLPAELLSVLPSVVEAA